jgi:hypothetical protein
VAYGQEDKERLAEEVARLREGAAEAAVHQELAVETLQVQPQAVG